MYYVSATQLEEKIEEFGQIGTTKLPWDCNLFLLDANTTDIIIIIIL